VVKTVTEGLDSPWGLAPLPDGDLLVSSRDTGKIFRIAAGSGKKTELGSVPGVSSGGEGGLLGIAVPPTFASDHLVYAYFTTDSDNRIVRMLYDEKKPRGEQLSAPDTILRGIPKGAVHNGGRIAFGPDMMLYAGTGESGDPGLAQDKRSLGGKILRMTPDGEPVHGNPEADSVIYSYGHRNVQGLAWDDDKRLWAAEFGQHAWDELNLIEPGRNYGWPVITYGINYNGRPISSMTHHQGMEQPRHYFLPSIGTSGLAIYDGDAFPRWRGDAFVGGLVGQQLARVSDLPSAPMLRLRPAP
jgi:glucose/arabinose dehydrogenase